MNSRVSVPVTLVFPDAEKPFCSKRVRIQINTLHKTTEQDNTRKIEQTIDEDRISTIQVSNSISIDFR